MSSMTHPRISIVVPSLNQGRTLRHALESILSQAYPNTEVVVFDGGSRDNSQAVIREFGSRIAYWRSEPDRGQAAAINEGVRHTTGDLVAWLNADDIYLDEAFWNVARAVREYPGYGLYLGNGFRLSEPSQQLRPFCPRHVCINRKALAHGLDYILQPAAFAARDAWVGCGGLREDLVYGLDWDLFLRITRERPVVYINEFLAISREYSETKTATGSIQRGLELLALSRQASGEQITPGGLYYFIESILQTHPSSLPSRIRPHLYQTLKELRSHGSKLWGAPDPFPVAGDPQDVAYLPLPKATDQSLQSLPGSGSGPLPTISVVVPSLNQGFFLERCLQSLFDQHYPGLEVIVIDGGSTDGSVEILRKYSDRVAFWISESDLGPADAINKGMSHATGEILGWLNADDMLAHKALLRVGTAFKCDGSLQAVYANALYIDAEDRLLSVDYGTHKTAFYFGSLHPLERVHEYWTYSHSIPQPTVYFRRGLLGLAGPLDARYHFIFDFDYFARLRKLTTFHKLEKTQAFYRIHGTSKTSVWSNFLGEEYRWSRTRWPSPLSRSFHRTAKSFLKSYLLRLFPDRPRTPRFWLEVLRVGAMVLLGVGNPEARLARLQGQLYSVMFVPSPPVDRKRGEFRYEVSPPREPRYRVLFSSFLWPMHPGHSGGEIRDFHLLRQLLKTCAVEFVAASDPDEENREDPLRPHFEAAYSPSLLAAKYPEYLAMGVLRRRLWTRALGWLRGHKIPVIGPRYHADISRFTPIVEATCVNYVRRRLRDASPDFLVVSPQLNPLALMLHSIPPTTRLILASYDVEHVRVARMADANKGLSKIAMRLESDRARQFEKDNLARYDGIIAVSNLDRDTFIRACGFPDDRIVVIENSVDTRYFEYSNREATTYPNVVFVGSMLYWPNERAAVRLLRRIMPTVRARFPEVRAWIVGGNPSAELTSLTDGKRTIVTGKVRDVRPYLDSASVVCVPLESGSGTKYKILEALSAGAPVICSPLSLEGLDRIRPREHLRVASTDDEFARAIVSSLEAPAALEALSNAARRIIEEHYSWEANLAKLDDWLTQIHSMPRYGREAMLPRGARVLRAAIDRQVR